MNPAIVVLGASTGRTAAERLADIDDSPLNSLCAPPPLLVPVMTCVRQEQVQISHTDRLCIAHRGTILRGLHADVRILRGHAPGTRHD